MLNIILLAISGICLLLTVYFITITALYSASTKHYLRSSSEFLSHDTDKGRAERELGDTWKARADRWWIFKRSRING